MSNLRMVWLGLVVLCGVFVVSCNSPAVEGPMPWAGIVRYNGDGTYTDAQGLVLVPSNPTWPSGSMMYIYCQVDPAGADPKRRGITFLADPMVIDGESFVADQPGGSSDKQANAAVQELRSVDVFGAYEPGLYDATTLVLPLLFYVKKETQPDLLAAELATHRLLLMCYTDQIKSGDADLKLYVHHVVEGSVSTPRTELSYSTFRAYALSDILAVYASKSGLAKPSRLLVYAQKNGASDQLGEGFSVEMSVEVPYTF